MSIATVSVTNPYFKVGQQLELTGQVNGIEQTKVVAIGQFASSAYQHTKDGQIVWINQTLLKEITNASNHN